MGFQQDWRKFFLLKFSSFFQTAPENMWKSVQPDPTDCRSVCTTTTRSRIVICLSVCLFVCWVIWGQQAVLAGSGKYGSRWMFSGHLRTTPGLLSYLWIYPAVGLPSQSREQRSGKHHGTQETKCLLLKNTQRNTHTHTNSTLFVAVVSGTGFYQVSALMYQRRSLSYTITKLWTRDWKL